MCCDPRDANVLPSSLWTEAREKYRSWLRSFRLISKDIKIKVDPAVAHVWCNVEGITPRKLQKVSEVKLQQNFLVETLIQIICNYVQMKMNMIIFFEAFRQ